MGLDLRRELLWWSVSRGFWLRVLPNLLVFLVGGRSGVSKAYTSSPRFWDIDSKLSDPSGCGSSDTASPRLD